jgi:predicted CxxxxCH...CXXCH cytochrome family protein
MGNSVNRIVSSIFILSGLIIALCGCDSKEHAVAASKYHTAVWTSFPSDGSHGKESLLTGIQECLSCHGNDLSGGIAEVACSECHGGGLDNCVACHGGLNDSTGAPPYDLLGSVDDTILAVGAHSSHVNGSEISDGVPCYSCHIVPDHPWDSAHFDFSLYDGPGIIDSIAEITWGGPESAAGEWDRNTGTCTNTYCHGNFPEGNNNSPVWTEPDPTICGSCHDDGNDIFQMQHGHILHTVLGVGCVGCHASTVDSNLNIIGPEFHVDGLADVKFFPDSGSFSDGTCYNPGGCHDGSRFW